MYVSLYNDMLSRKPFVIGTSILNPLPCFVEETSSKQQFSCGFMNARERDAFNQPPEQHTLNKPVPVNYLTFDENKYDSSENIIE